jgi:hypothetical protein
VKSPVSSYDFDDSSSELSKELFNFCEEVLKKNINFAPYASAIMSRLSEVRKKRGTFFSFNCEKCFFYGV